MKEWAFLNLLPQVYAYALPFCNFSSTCPLFGPLCSLCSENVQQNVPHSSFISLMLLLITSTRKLDQGEYLHQHNIGLLRSLPMTVPREYNGRPQLVDWWCYG